MAKINNLLRRDGGTYYFRAVVPQHVRAVLGPLGRELCVSLRTKCVSEAKFLLNRKRFIMSEYFKEPQPWEVEAEIYIARYKKGLALLRKYGPINTDDPYEVDALTDEIEGDDLRAYLTALSARNGLKFDDDQLRSIELVEQAQRPQKEREPVGSHPHSTEELSKAAERFLQLKQRAVKTSTLDTYKPKLLLFCRVVAESGCSNIGQLKAEHIRKYADLLPLLPKRTMATGETPLSTVVASGGQPMSSKTVFAHACLAKEFLQWCEEQRYQLEAGLGGILKPLLVKKSDGGRVPFDSHNLQKIFESEEYTTRGFSSSVEFWAPLIALFSGARQGEICQLLVSDIRREFDTWVFDINRDGEKDLKTSTSSRLVPVHPSLVDLGFLEYVNRMKDVDKRLFPEVARNARGEFSTYSKMFLRFRDKVGIKTSPKAMKDFHSFRHTFTTGLFDRQITEPVINAICGHSNRSNSEGGRSYLHSLSMDTMRRAVASFNPPVDLSTIRRDCWRCK